MFKNFLLLFAGSIAGICSLALVGVVVAVALSIGWPLVYFLGFLTGSLVLGIIAIILWEHVLG